MRAKVSRIVRGSIVSGHFAEASSADSAKEGCGKVLTDDCTAATEVDKGHCWRVLEHLDVTCKRFEEASSADWSAKEGCGNVLTGALGALEVDTGHFWRVFKDLDVTCGTFADASSADWSAKEGCGNVLTGDSSKKYN